MQIDDPTDYEYVLIQWPESQEIIDKEWRTECILMNDINHLDSIGPAAYFVPKNRYLELINSILNH